MNNKQFFFPVLAIALLFFSAFRKPFILPAHATEKDKIWIEDSVKKIRYMRKVVILNNKEWTPDNMELNFQISSATVGGKKNAELTAKVKYGGGCKTHRFQLVKPHQTAKDTLQLFLTHEANGDNCRAFVNNEMTFDVTKLKLKKNKKVLMINSFRVN